MRHEPDTMMLKPGNYYGTLKLIRRDGQFYVRLDNYDGKGVDPISEELARKMAEELARDEDDLFYNGTFDEVFS